MFSPTLLAGSHGGQSIEDTDDATFQRVFDLNLNSFFTCSGRRFQFCGRPATGGLSRSGVERRSNPELGSVPTALPKLPLSLIRTVALENKDAGLRANVILPGTMDTPANRESIPNADFSKWVKPGAVAGLITWLASDAGNDINGAVIPVYGNDV